MPALLLDHIKFALRQFRRRWLINLGICLSFALCLGLNVAVFSVFNSVVLRPLPFPDEDQIVEIFNAYPKQNIPKGMANIPMYLEFQEKLPGVEAIALTRFTRMTLTRGNQPELVSAITVTPGYFDVLGMMPERGNPFTQQHGELGQDNVVILKHDFWKSNYGAQQSLLGTFIQLDNRSYEVVGIMPEAYDAYLPTVDVVVPYTWAPDDRLLQLRHLSYGMLLGRLGKESSPELTESQIAILDKQYLEANPDSADFINRSGHKTLVRRHASERNKSMRPLLGVLQAFALLILLIGTLNITNLRVTEILCREREFIMRRVLGAPFKTLLVQLLVEAGLIGILGGLTGLVAAVLSMRLIRTAFTNVIEGAEFLIGMDIQVLAWSLFLILFTVLVVGIIPVTVLRRLQFQQLLQEGSQTLSSRRGVRLRSTLGIVQIAMATLLLTASIFFVRSFLSATNVELGFDADKVNVLSVRLPQSNYPDGDARATFVRESLTRIRSLPGVESACVSSSTPIVSPRSHFRFQMLGKIFKEGEGEASADEFRITDGFFETLGIAVTDGRPILATDTDDAHEVFVVDQETVERFLDKNALEARITFGNPPEAFEDWPRVVGIAPRIVHQPLLDPVRNALIYRSFYSRPPPYVNFLIRSQRDSDSLVMDARKQISQLDPNLPISTSGRLDRLISDSLDSRRAILGLTLLFAAVALLLASASVYNIQIHRLNSASHELAIRASLGAGPSRLFRQCLYVGLILSIVGIAIGLLTSMWIERYAGPLVTDLPANDFASLLLSAVLITGLTLLFLVPSAWCASRRNPAAILHER